MESIRTSQRGGVVVNSEELFRVRKYKKPTIVKAGCVTIKVYKTRWWDKKRRRYYTKHVIRYANAQGPQREQFSDSAVALERAQQIANSIANGEITMEEFRQADRAEWELARRTAAPIGKPIPLIIADAAKAHQLAPQVSLEQMAQAYLELHPVGQCQKTAADILPEMIIARIQDGKSRNTIDDYRSRLKAFAKDFTAPLSSITAADIDSWLRKLPVSARTRNNYRGNLCDLYRFAIQRGYVRKEHNPISEVAVAKNEPIRIELFTPNEVTRLLIARKNFEVEAMMKKRPVFPGIPYLALAFFGGMRHEELCPGRDHKGKQLPGLDWSDIDFEDKEIHVHKHVARKIGRDRIVPMSDNLAAWLAPYALESGRVCKYANFNNELMELSRRAKVPWKDNGPRKTFISTRLAITNDFAKVAYEAGTSEGRILANYHKAVKKVPAQKHFSIFPGDPIPPDETQVSEKIVQMPLAL